MSLTVTENIIVSVNPATGEELGKVKIYAADEVKAVVERARSAFRNWSE
ncbi:MAG: aldehyde dehydrogenase family protein, partial [Acidobacteria bacterium]